MKNQKVIVTENPINGHDWELIISNIGIYACFYNPGNTDEHIFAECDVQVSYIKRDYSLNELIQMVKDEVIEYHFGYKHIQVAE